MSRDTVAGRDEHGFRNVTEVESGFTSLVECQRGKAGELCLLVGSAGFIGLLRDIGLLLTVGIGIEILSLGVGG